MIVFKVDKLVYRCFKGVCEILLGLNGLLGEEMGLP
jgi:hypothetical protein